MFEGQEPEIQIDPYSPSRERDDKYYVKAQARKKSIRKTWTFATLCAVILAVAGTVVQLGMMTRYQRETSKPVVIFAIQLAVFGTLSAGVATWVNSRKR